METWNDWIIAHESTLRLWFFLGILGTMALWEQLAPRRARTQSMAVRWGNNFALVFLNTAIVRFVVPLLAVGTALWAERNGFGVLHWLGGGLLWKVIFTIIFLDFIVYWQHRIFHMIPMFWKLHRMHHQDLDYDVTTGSRFHPVEIVISMLLKMAIVALLGLPAAGVILFEIILNGTAMFNHSNVGLPKRIEPWVRAVLVTQDMHRVHHSVRPEEHHQNFGFALSIWDRLFGSYTAEPADGQTGMTIGLPYYREPRELYLDRLVTQPFRDPDGPAEN